MDRHELNIKVEQLKKLVREGDYKTAAEIADAIDWRKVQSSNLLSIVSDVYENIGEYTEAKTILLMAYEKSSMGKRILYRLTELAIKEGSIDEAYKYYEEFERVAMDDSRVYLLRYKMLTAKHADINQRIHALETYNARELDEKYQYVLAELYYEAGRTADSVRVCDNIMLMFGLGHYVEKAIELKTTKLGIELTDYQQGLIINREHYAEKLREVELEYSGEYDAIYTESYEKEEDSVSEVDAIDAEIAAHMRALESGRNEEPVAIPTDEEIGQAGVEMPTDEIDLRGEVAPQENIQAENIADISISQANLLEESVQEEDTEDAFFAVVQASAASTFAPEAEDVEEEEDIEEEAVIAVAQEILPEKKADTKNLYLVLASKDVSKALQESMDRIRAWNDGRDKKPATKTSAERLNARGLLAVKEKIQDKIVVIENAGDLHAENLDILSDWIQSEKEDISFVLLDTPLQISNLIRKYKVLEEYFEIDFIDKVPQKQVQMQAIEVGDIQEVKKTERKEEDTPSAISIAIEDAVPTVVGGETADGAVVQKRAKKRAVGASEQNEDGTYTEAFWKEKLNVEGFVQYASEYARKIDCSISGKSLLALYERAEIMEADGDVLSRESAKELIEEVADIAENPPLTSKVKALLTFDKKYDKNDRLILKEEYFIS